MLLQYISLYFSHNQLCFNERLFKTDSHLELFPAAPRTPGPRSGCSNVECGPQTKTKLSQKEKNIDSITFHQWAHRFPDTDHSRAVPLTNGKFHKEKRNSVDDQHQKVGDKKRCCKIKIKKRFCLYSTAHTAAFCKGEPYYYIHFLSFFYFIQQQLQHKVCSILQYQ